MFALNAKAKGHNDSEEGGSTGGSSVLKRMRALFALKPKPDNEEDSRDPPQNSVSVPSARAPAQEGQESHDGSGDPRKKRNKASSTNATAQPQQQRSSRNNASASRVRVRSQAELDGGPPRNISISSSIDADQSDQQLQQQGSPLGEDSLRTVSTAGEMFRKCNRARLYAGKVVNSDRVQWFIVCLIAINAIMLGIGTFDFVDENDNVKKAFEIVDKVFLVIFTIELGFQFLYHGWRLLLNGWLVFDLVVITLSWGFETLQVVRAFRIFRALRLVTRIKTMKNLIVAIFGVVPRIAAITLLLFLIFYIFSVMFTALFSDLEEEGFTDWDYYGRLDLTFFTLFQLMTLDNWASIARQTIDAESLAWIPIIAFVTITGFIVVNLIIAVICDAIAALNEDDIARFHGVYEASESEIDINGADFYESIGDISRLSVRTQDELLQKQIDSLSDQVEELSRAQEETILALNQLTLSITKRKKTKDKGDSNG